MFSVYTFTYQPLKSIVVKQIGSYAIMHLLSPACLLPYKKKYAAGEQSGSIKLLHKNISDNDHMQAQQ